MTSMAEKVYMRMKLLVIRGGCNCTKAQETMYIHMSDHTQTKVDMKSKNLSLILLVSSRPVVVALLQ